MASASTKLRARTVLAAAETTPPPLEVNPVLVGEGVPLVLTDEGDPDWVDEGVPGLALGRLEEVGG